MEKNTKLQIYLPIAFALVLIAGIWLGTNLSSGKQVSNYRYNKLSDVIDYIVNDYVDSVDIETLEQDAIEAMLKELDPHSIYITKEEFDAVNDPLVGSFEGIGITFRIEKDTITVINPISGGPSEKVGLMAGDRIVKVNDSLIAGVGLKNNDAMHLLKGKKGTKVDVSVFRRGVPKLINFTITRDVIPNYSLDIAYMVDKNTGYIKLNKFSTTTYNEFITAAMKLKSQGMNKLILDLRGNTGGLLQSAIEICDEFLENGLQIVYTEGKNRPRRHAFATSRGNLEDIDVAVIIDENSASASEIIAGALQDNDKGMIIGRRSFGKGLVQEQINLPDGSGIRITVARYHTPTGRCIQRHYENGDIESYYEDYYERYLNGEMYSEDSIVFDDSLKYYTPKGKVVYGGGGIMPDIYVPLITDTINTFYNLLANKGLIYQFAFDYTDRNRAFLNSFKDFESFNKNFNMNDKTYDELVEYAQGQRYKNTSRQGRCFKRKNKYSF